MEPAPAVYLGVFLDKKSSSKLLRNVPPSFEQVYADHVTIVFKPTEEQQKSFKAGKKIWLLVTGVYGNDNIQAVSVRGVKTSNGHPHITISATKGTKPKFSTELLATTKKLQWKFMLLRGKLDTYPRSFPEKTP